MKLAVIQVPGQLSPPWRLSQHQGLLELALHPQGAASLPALGFACEAQDGVPPWLGAWQWRAGVGGRGLPPE